MYRRGARLCAPAIAIDQPMPLTRLAHRLPLFIQAEQAGIQSDDLLRCLAQGLPLQPPLHAHVLTGSDIEAHPRRALEMRTEYGAWSQHNTLALGHFCQGKRIPDVREARPHEHPVCRLDQQLHSKAFERAHYVETRLTKPFMQAREVLAVVSIHMG